MGARFLSDYGSDHSFSPLSDSGHDHAFSFFAGWCRYCWFSFSLIQSTWSDNGSTQGTHLSLGSAGGGAGVACDSSTHSWEPGLYDGGVVNVLGPAWQRKRRRSNSPRSNVLMCIIWIDHCFWCCAILCGLASRCSRDANPHRMANAIFCFS